MDTNQIPKAPDHTVVNLQEEYNKTDIQTIIDNLERFVGLQPKSAYEIAALLLVDRLRKNLGMEAGNPGLHMSFVVQYR